MMSRTDWLDGEPGLDEVMADPIVHLVMRRDGLSADMVRAAVAAGVARLAGAAAGQPAEPVDPGRAA